MPEEKQRKKRIRVEKLDEWIEILKLIERVNRDSEYFKQNAIPYLEQYVDSLKEAGRKTVVLEEKEMRPEAATSIRRTENNINKL